MRREEEGAVRMGVLERLGGSFSGEESEELSPSENGELRICAARWGRSEKCSLQKVDRA